jgi:sugar phosphate isomerase/epimerase
MNLSAITEVRKAGVYFEAGFTTIDISFCGTIYEAAKHDPILDGDDWEARVEELAKQFKQQGIRVNTTHLPYRYHYENPDEENYAYHYEMTRRSLIASERLGAKWAVVHVNTVEATMAHVKKLFADTGVKSIGLAIENMAKLPVEDLIEAHDRLKGEGYRVGICYDIGHCHMTLVNNYDTTEMIYRLGERICMLHLHDNCRNGDHHRIPFAGTIRWEDAMRALKDVGFAGDFNYELNLSVVPKPLQPAYMRYACEIALYLSSVFESHVPEKKEETL